MAYGGSPCVLVPPSTSFKHGCFPESMKPIHKIPIETILRPVPEYDCLFPAIPADWRILVTGVTSIHGWPLYSALKKHLPPQQLFALRPPKMKVPAGDRVIAACITDKTVAESVHKRFNPTHILHCSGVCDLDVCEERPQWARQINVGGAEIIRSVFGDSCHLLYLSTDLVFSGNNPPLGGYAEHHIPDPVSVAGKTFRMAEEVIESAPRGCIVRLGLPVGGSIMADKGGFDFVAGRFRRNLPVSLFYDELRSCLRCDQLPAPIVHLLRNEVRGLFHFGGADAISLHELGMRICAFGDYDPHLLKRLSRFEERDGPPRIGDVTLDSSKFRRWVEESARLPHHRDGRCNFS